MTDFVDLMVGEVLLGDSTNRYLYVGEDLEMAQITMGYFLARIREEKQPITSCLATIGKVTVNGTQQFFFIHKDQLQCVTHGLSFNRVFMEISDPDVYYQVKERLRPCVIDYTGDFVW